MISRVKIEHYSSLDYAALYPTLRLHRAMEGGAEYVAVGADYWVFITDESTAVWMLDEEDRGDLAKASICVRSFESREELEQFTAALALARTPRAAR